MLEHTQTQTRAKFFRNASKQTVDWYRSTSARTKLSYWQVQRLKMLSYGIPVPLSDFVGMERESVRNAIYKIKRQLPWLKVRFVPPGSYVVLQPCLDELKQFLEAE